MGERRNELVLSTAFEPQLVLGMLSIGDIRRGAHPLNDPAPVVLQGNRAAPEPSVRAVFAAIAELGLERGA